MFQIRGMTNCFVVFAVVVWLAFGFVLLLLLELLVKHFHVYPRLRGLFINIREELRLWRIWWAK